MDTPVNSSTSNTAESSPLLMIIYWLVVGIPLAWGVFQTAQKSVPLFHVTGAPAVATPAAPPEK